MDWTAARRGYTTQTVLRKGPEWLLSGKAAAAADMPGRLSLLLPVEAAKPWPLDLDLAAVKADLALRLPPAVRLSVAPRAWRGPQTACASRSIISQRASMPEARQNSSKLPDMFESASSLSALVGTTTVDVVSLFMALLSFRGISTPSLQLTSGGAALKLETVSLLEGLPM
jgi:hypothetical protein